MSASNALMEFYFQDKKDADVSSKKSMRIQSPTREVPLQKLDAIREEIANGSLGRLGKAKDHNYLKAYMHKESKKMKMVFINAPKRKLSSNERSFKTLIEKAQDPDLRNICKTDGTNSVASQEDNS